MAVVSDDHADARYDVSGLQGQESGGQRWISAEEVQSHNGKESFWAVVDGFVVDATAFVDSHPGGLRKLLSTDKAGVGATGAPFSFSFSRGRNAHFPDTGKRFAAGAKRYLRDGTAEVDFPGHGKLVILGRLKPR